MPEAGAALSCMPEAGAALSCVPEAGGAEEAFLLDVVIGYAREAWARHGTEGRILVVCLR